LVGAYAALVLHHREQGRLAGWRGTTSRAGGLLGAVAGALGLSTGPCSVLRCGGSGVRVVGRVHAGLSTGAAPRASRPTRTSSASAVASWPGSTTAQARYGRAGGWTVP